jgi:hypothetical protein
MYAVDAESGEAPSWLEFRALAAGLLLFVQCYSIQTGSNRQHDEGSHHQTLFDDLWIVQQMIQQVGGVTYTYNKASYIHWENLAEAMVSLHLAKLIHLQQQQRFSIDKLKRMVGILKALSLPLWQTLYDLFDQAGADCAISFELLDSSHWRGLAEKDKTDCLQMLCSGKLATSKKAIEYCKQLPGESLPWQALITQFSSPVHVGEVK